MNRRLALVAVPVVCLGLGSAALWGVDKVGTNNEKGRALKERPGVWTLNFAYNRPRFITVDEPGKGRVVYWYLAYEVYNYTGQDRMFVPAFELVTDTDKRYFDLVDPLALRKVRLLEGDVPRLEDSISISGLIKAVSPEDTKVKKRGVALFREVDPKTDAFTIYVTGLSNGYRQVVDEKESKPVIMYKTLALKFSMPGDEYYPDDEEIRNLGWEWIYR